MRSIFTIYQLNQSKLVLSKKLKSVLANKISAFLLASAVQSQKRAVAFDSAGAIAFIWTQILEIVFIIKKKLVERAAYLSQSDCSKAL